MTSLLALLSSLLWGSADFEGGRLSKRHAPIAVLGFSQIIGLLFGVGLLIAYGDWSTPALGEGGFLIPGIGAGFFGYFGLICLYAGLASGSMGVVSPISSLSAVIPLSYALYLKYQHLLYLIYLNYLHLALVYLFSQRLHF